MYYIFGFYNYNRKYGHVKNILSFFVQLVALAKSVLAMQLYIPLEYLLSLDWHVYAIGISVQRFKREETLRETAMKTYLMYFVVTVVPLYR